MVMLYRKIKIDLVFCALNALGVVIYFYLGYRTWSEDYALSNRVFYEAFCLLPVLFIYFLINLLWLLFIFAKYMGFNFKVLLPFAIWLLFGFLWYSVFKYDICRFSKEVEAVHEELKSWRGVHKKVASQEKTENQ